jgi:hypothetical protein
VADGARTHDNRNHNPGLYQLSYSHHQENSEPYLNSLKFLVTDKIENFVACPTGIEPVTPSLEGWCSIRLSYGHFSIRVRLPEKTWSGWRDLNSRHPGPKPGALPGYATPRKKRHYTFSREKRQFKLGQVLAINS